MKLILLRHAARLLSSTGDAELSPQGQAQAENLVAWVQQGRLAAPTVLISSPKKRAKQTLGPLAAAHELTIQIDSRLDERHHNETRDEFEARIRDWVTDIHAQAEALRNDRAACAYIASHLDWLEAALLAIDSNLTDREHQVAWSNAEFRVFRIDDGIWNFIASGTVPWREEV